MKYENKETGIFEFWNRKQGSENITTSIDFRYFHLNPWFLQLDVYQIWFCEDVT